MRQYLFQLLIHEPAIVPQPKPVTYFGLLFLVTLDENRHTLLGRLMQHRN